MSEASGSGSASSSGVALTRLQRELGELMTSPPDGVCAFPHDDDLFLWDATLTGPSNSPYDGLEYKLKVRFPPEYPFAPPKVRFVTQCFHPNVALDTGHICLDILMEQWSAVLTATSVLVSIQSLLLTPNNNSPLNRVAADHWEQGGERYKEMVRQYYFSTSSTNAAAAGGGGGSGMDTV